MKRNEIDGSILLVIGALVIILLLIFTTRHLLTPKCPIVGFAISGTADVHVGQTVMFTDTTVGVSNRDWDFGDGTTHDNRQNVTHIFNHSGLFHIVLRVNECDGVTKDIAISEQIKVQAPIDSTVFIAPLIEGPKSVYVNQKAQFFDKTPNATSWDWFFSENDSVDSHLKEPTYTFLKPGKKTITLVVNGKSQQGRFVVNVLQPKIPNPSKPTINEADMALNLMKISRKEIMPSFFEPFLCNDLTIPLLVNGVTTYSFASYCGSIRITPPKNIHVTEIKRDPVNKCPVKIYVEETK